MSKAIGQLRSFCYLSTPEHLRSFVGQFVYLYTNTGELCLTENTLQFVSNNGLTLEIDLDLIENLSVGSYSRLMKPLRLDYIAIRYLHRDVERTTLLTPTRSWLTPVWETNKIVAEWMACLQETVSRQA